MSDTNTETDLPFTDAELNATYLVEGIEQITDVELQRLARLSVAVLNDQKNPQFFKWLQSVVLNEAKIRDSQGKLERGFVSLACIEDWPQEARESAMIRLNCFIESFELNHRERKFMLSLYWAFISWFIIKHSSNGIDDLYSKADVARALGVSEAAVMRMVQKNTIAAPIRLSPKTLRWRARDIIALVQD